MPPNCTVGSADQLALVIHINEPRAANHPCFFGPISEGAQNSADDVLVDCFPACNLSTPFDSAMDPGQFRSLYIIGRHLASDVNVIHVCTPVTCIICIWVCLCA